MQKKEIINLAKKIYNKYNTTDPLKIAFNIGCTVIYSNMPAKIKGYTLKIYRSNLIYINENLNEIETRNTILHELGHIFCKHDENRIFTSLKTHQVTSKLENQADLFTVAMLINALEEEELERYNLKQLSYMLGISEELLKLYFF
ncbi:ImmA/IrrE family metallo-endopeptidase [Peptoniphilus ovalis]